MITEAMLKYYFNKCLKLDKDKFRFISTEEVNFKIEKHQHVALKDPLETPDESVTVIKVLIEIVDDQDSKHTYSLIVCRRG